MRMLGMPQRVFRDSFVPNVRTKVKSKTQPLSVSTSTYIDLEIANEMRMTLDEYRKLPIRYRKMRLFHRVLAGEKERFSYDEAKRKSDQESRMNQRSTGKQGRFR